MALRRAFTLIEILVVVAIISILAALLLPVLIGARDKARQSACASNLRQVGAAIQMYADDHDSTFPVGAYPVTPPLPAQPYQVNWRDELVFGRYVTHLGIFTCPSAPNSDYRSSFGVNWRISGWNTALKLDAVNWPAYTVLVTERRGGDWPVWRPSDHGLSPYWAPLDVRHNNNSLNILFADGHVGRVAIGEFIESSQVLWIP